MNFLDQLNTLKQQLEEVKTQRIKLRAELEHLDQERQELLSALKELDIEPQDIDKCIEELEQTIQNQMLEVQTKLDEQSFLQ